MLIQTHLIETVGQVKCVIIFDDIARYLSKFGKKCETVVSLFSEYRHFDLTIFVALQSPNLIKSDSILANVSYAWIYKVDSEDSYKDIYKNFGRKFKNWKAFREWIEKNNKNHQIIIYDRNKLVEPYIIYKHGLPPTFKIEF